MIDPNLISKTLDTLLGGGADFADIYVERKRAQGFEWRESKIKAVTSTISFGAGLRLVYGQEVIYVYTNDLSPEALLAFAKDASQIKMTSHSNAIGKAQELQRQKIAANNDFNLDHAFWNIAHSARVDRCKVFENAAKSHRSTVTDAIAGFGETKKEILIANSEGLLVEDTKFYSKYSLSIHAESNGVKEVAYHGNGRATTSDYFDTQDFAAMGREIAELADDLTKAKFAPSGEMPVIIGRGQGTLIHEACGHSLETTSVADGDSVFSNRMGEMVANKCVSLIDDGTIKNLWGSINIDDEGTPVQKTTLIKEGKLVSYLSDRLGAQKIDHPRTGSARRESYKYAPTSRMRSTYIDAGQDSFEEMIASIESGLYVKGVGGGSVSPATGEYQFQAIESYQIKNGKIGDLVKGATLIGRGDQTMKDITMVSDRLQLEGGGMCGSRSGAVPVDVGQPDVLISKLLIGGRA